MDARLQRRIQRSGWDLAADFYESLWRDQLAPAAAALLELAGLKPGERVLDVACGTGLISFAAVEAVGSAGIVLGVDISGAMVDAAQQQAEHRGVGSLGFSRMDAEALDLPDGGFDVALCGLGLMYAPEPEKALREMWRVLRPGGRIAVSVWGERDACGWAAVFPIVDAEVASDVCPLFFRLGADATLSRLIVQTGFAEVVFRRLTTRLAYADGDVACDAAFVGGPVAMAWSRFDAATRERARQRYLEAIAAWEGDDGYAIPGEFVVVAARKPAEAATEADRKP